MTPLLIVIGIYVAYYFLYRPVSTYWEKMRVPHKSLSLIANASETFFKKPSPAEYSQELYDKFKGERFAGIWYFFAPMLLARDPELIRAILTRDFAYWSSRGIVINEKEDPLGENLVNLSGVKWKVMRSKLNGAFSGRKMKHMFNMLEDCSREFESALRGIVKTKDMVEIKEISARFMTDVIGHCVFGIQIDTLNDKNIEFRTVGKEVFEVTLRIRLLRVIQMAFPNLFKLIRAKVHSKRVTGFIVNLVKDTFKYREEKNIQRNDFIDLLREMRKKEKQNGIKDGVEFNDAFLAAQAYAFLAAGFETSSTTLSYCVHELAVNEEIQNKLRQEIFREKTKNNGIITLDNIKNMKYLDKLFNETLRKYPTIPMITREVTKSYTIPGTDIVLPVGLKCLLPIYAIHRDPKYYPDPERFDPERFNDEVKRERPAHTFLPFGGGPRFCLGARFAEMQVKVGLIKVIENFHLSLCEKSTNPLEQDNTARFLGSKTGIWVRVHPTNRQTD
ncbi:probable cytochrome P450 6a13 isoform X1 [Cephus cinctus]|uniref:Probable cytochrome P450 6a13 isoform X1 n=1 Tax=Cephus cinctus TaxID=211228 RepID=A0AAJ7BVL9_CEPCN|nr:probable cytochrome P450 6a13 isoform X1 [Cephus cinctus]